MTEPTQTTSAPAPQADGGLRLLDAFRELHAEAVRGLRALAGPEPPDPDSVKHRLLAILARHAAEERDRWGERAMPELDKAQYVMIAMADEVILQGDWPGREAWARRPLEAESRFGTQSAGQVFFVRLDEILTGRAPTSGGLLCVYLAALSLGFRGRYRLDPRSTEPDRYRRDLIDRLRQVEPRLMARSSEICPEALDRVQSTEPRRGLTSLREGLLPLVAVVVGMLVVGHVLWLYRTTDVRDRLDRIEEVRERLEKQRKAALELREKEPRDADPKEGAAPDGGAP